MNERNINSKKYIEEIQRKYENSDRDIVLDSLAGAIDRLQKAFPGRGHFLMEFIQNADDANSTSMRIEIDSNCIKIFNNGGYFTANDVKSICKVGRSSKTPEHYIGYLGVGFKSVFLISNCPQVYSGSFRFKFDKKHWENSENIPWQVMPIWIKNNLDIQNKTWKTVFIIPKAEEMGEKIMQKLEEEVSSEHLNNRIILFLRNINEIEICDKLENIKRKIVKSETISKSNYEICSVDEYVNDELKVRDRWLIFRNPECVVPIEVKEDQATIDWERQIVTKREVLVVFRLDDKDNLLEEEKGTAHTGVFSFLPLKETESGLKFLVQTDFLTTPGRADIQRESLWNVWLANEIYKLVEEKCIPEFLENKKWKFNFTQVLYPGYGGHELFDKSVKKPLELYLKTNAVLIAEDGSTANADELISIASGVRELITDDDLKILYPNKKVIHSNCRTDNLDIRKAPSNVLDFVTDFEIEKLILKKAEEGDIEWFKRLYDKLNEYNGESLRKKIKYSNIILTKDNDLVEPDKVYIKSENTSIPVQLKDNYKIVHPALALNSKDFFEKLDIEELTDEHIKYDLKIIDIQVTKKDWENFSDSEKFNKIEDYKNLLNEDKIFINDLSFLTVQTKGENWLKPSEIIFPREYNPGHNLEILSEKGLLDYPLEFLSTEFIDKSDVEELKQWRDFFENMGVDSKIKDGKEKDRIVERIAILTTLYFEKKKKNRDAYELTESERGDPGYDIISKYQNKEEMYIEVKGSSEKKPEKMLSKNQTKTLMDEKDKYFVYGVVDVLDNPTLYVIKGGKILDEEEFRIPIRPAKWEELKEEKYQPLLDSMFAL